MTSLARKRPLHTCPITSISRSMASTRYPGQGPGRSIIVLNTSWSSAAEAQEAGFPGVACCVPNKCPASSQLVWLVPPLAGAHNNCWPERNNPQAWPSQRPGCQIYLIRPHNSCILQKRATVDLRLCLLLSELTQTRNLSARYPSPPDSTSSLQLQSLFFLCTPFLKTSNSPSAPIDL